MTLTGKESTASGDTPTPPPATTHSEMVTLSNTPATYFLGRRVTLLNSSARMCRGAVMTREVAEGMSLLESRGSPPAPLAASMYCVEGPVTEWSEMPPWLLSSPPLHSVKTTAVEVMLREKRVR